MISGFNTDIEFDGVVYHVQTEDKGLRSAELMTLVYDKGTILASKRASYRDLTEGELNDDELADRLNRQHKLICAAIRAGRIDDLIKMTRTAAAKKRESGSKTAQAAESIEESSPPPTPAIEFEATETADLVEGTPDIPMPVATPNFDGLFVDTQIVEDATIVEEEVVLLDPTAIEVISELSGTERQTHEKLTIELFGESRYKSGDRVTLSMMICRGTARRIVPSAKIMVKALGSAFRPVIFHAESDANGLANIHFQIPVFRTGRAALLIRVIADGEEVELRRMVTPG